MKDELFRANRFDIISRLADDLAHEIKNPLNAIVINLEVLKVRLGRGDVEAALDRASVIDEETRRLHGLIDRILQLLRQTREDSGGLALDQVLDEVLPLFAAQARLAHNEFSQEGGAAVSVAVKRDLLKFALLNILTAMHDRLGERNGRIVLRCETDDTTVTLNIHPIPLGSMPATDGSVGDAVDIADALLAHADGTVSAAGDGVTIVLPRGT